MTTISVRLSDPTRLTTTAGVMASAASRWTSVVRWFRSTVCVINGGHYKLLHTEPNRLALRCIACGHMSPGWAVGSPRFSERVASERKALSASRHTVVA